MLQIAICDDEQFYREKIQTLLEGYLEKRMERWFGKRGRFKKCGTKSTEQK